MKVKQLLMCVSFLVSGQALANVTEYCPSPSDIKELAAGIYKAPTASGDGEWYGVSQAGRGPIGEFELAIFAPRVAAERGIVAGEILRCGYKLQNGGDLDMRYKREGTIVSIDTSGPWEQWYGQYYCESKEARACAFTENVRTKR
ncbi:MULTISPECIES: DUF3757 domain-containing protein [unclassified Pseudomonas]|uniref:DUF3757 domain-containing protein n=1 Tax=unclassified Pseudomonas TaxID=196821 RepID=UPI000C88EC21|nr:MULTISPECIES: DUF3757 domain-containing protein [unclassified Pseudomonas]PMZ86052.1 hypothetical protein C1X61_24505 [Pseudomonas sp. FW215-T2]PNA08494.1 hypothetical protein C1X62_24755 [Pseudomonas sp. FW215-R3]PNB34735.1 hypothetical protein C1X63_25745 [Pseudomonas sp. FW305-131]